MNARDVLLDGYEQLEIARGYVDEIIDGALADLREAAGGADRVVLAWEPKPCETCEGVGHAHVNDPHGTKPCPVCGGEGAIDTPKACGTHDHCTGTGPGCSDPAVSPEPGGA